MKLENAIEITNLSKVFTLRQARVDENGVVSNEHWALKDVTFEIKKGESVGIIGPNGSGKSTLLKILAGVTKPTSGSVKIKGKVASILDIGAGFHPELSGRENVYLNGQIHGFSKKEIESKFDEIVEFSGIEKFIDEPVKNYSNGMYLRLAFSIMAHLDFDVYLFDEVMSVGDAEFQNKINQISFDFKRLQKTILHVSHEVNRMISINPNTIYLVNKGCLEKKGRLEIIDDYLYGESHNKALINLTNFYDIKEIKNSNNCFQIDKCYISGQQILPDGICNQKGFYFVFEIQLFMEQYLDIAIKILDRNKSQILLLTSLQSDRYYLHKVGKYKIEFKLPGQLLNKGIYDSDLLIIQDKRNEIYELPSFVTFQLSNKNDNCQVKNDQFYLKSIVSPPTKINIVKI